MEKKEIATFEEGTPTNKEYKGEKYLCTIHFLTSPALEKKGYGYFETTKGGIGSGYQ